MMMIDLVDDQECLDASSTRKHAEDHMKKTTSSIHSGRTSATRGKSNLRIQLKSFGPDQAALDAIAKRVLPLAAVQKYLKNARHRLVSVVLVEPDFEVKPNRATIPPNRFRMTIYDYTNRRTLFVDGRVDKPTLVEVSESASQPLPSSGEFDEAVTIVARDSELGPSLREGRLRSPTTLAANRPGSTATSLVPN
jgi:hypothetical protein